MIALAYASADPRAVVVVHGYADVAKGTVEGARGLDDVAGGTLFANDFLVLCLAGRSLVAAEASFVYSYRVAAGHLR